ncbi:Matrin-3 [Oryzias melastigma]|uniref:Matrin-3 n=1 Tax=Oryzias melastigma TaxID=30732 RepID=A0A834FP01_ORYME|nr:Matrin-3 [Oryzias melastigma]
MSQSDGGQKPFSVGRGLLAAAETLNFNMNEQRSGRPMGGMSSGVGMSGVEHPDGSPQMPRRGSTNNLGSTMKLFASLGLSPSDLDALAEIPEEEISVETLPRILMQLKNRKGEAGERRAVSSMSSEAAFQGGRDSWDEGRMGRMGGPSMGEGLARSKPSADFGYSSMQNMSSGRGLGSSFGSGGGGRGDRPYSELSHQTSYGGLDMGPSQSDSVFMQRRIGSPSVGKVQDFLGVMPSMFPHVCSLCDFDVHSTMEWNQHLSGLRHAENRRLLLDMYPDWDPSLPSGRGGRRDTPNLSAGLLGPAPMSSAGMSSSWGGGGGPGLPGHKMGLNTLRSRVVVVKYERKPLSNNTLFAFTERFGRLREHLVLKNKAFLEMSSHEEALDMVNYYKQHTASLYGKPITFYLSQRLMFIEKDSRMSEGMGDRPMRDVKSHGSKVVFFSNLPREEEKKRELLTIAGRFGTVDKHLFLTDQAFVQLGTVEDAEMLVKYYSVNPLTIRGRLIRLNICTKYKTLNVNRRQSGSAEETTTRKRSRTRERSSSPAAKSASRTTSSKSTSKSREEKKKEEEEEDKEKPAEEEVTGVVQGAEDEEEDQASDDEDPKAEDPEKETVEKDVKEEEKEVPDDATPVEEAEPEVKKQEAEPEGAAETSVEEAENKEEAVESGDVAEGDVPAEELDQDFLENMEDFVTLDELEEDEGDAPGESDAIDNSKKGGMRVVNIVGFRRGYNFLNELLNLAKPFGKVVKHLVLDLRPEAYIQFQTENEARAMAKFYGNGNVTVSVCGRPVRVSHSLSYPTIQCGSSRVVYIGQLPNTKYTDEEILELATPYGKVQKYFLNRIKRECFLEMDRPEDAEKMAEDCKSNPPKINGKRLTIYVSRKYRHLKYGHRCGAKRANSPPPKSSLQPEEPSAKKAREEDEEEQVEKKEEETKEEEAKEDNNGGVENEEQEAADEEAQSSDVGDSKPEENSENPLEDSEKIDEEEKRQQDEDMETATNQNGQTEAPPPVDGKPSLAALPLPPYDPDTPIGVEHVKMGYYCRICFLFYTNETTAKKTHCSSQTHYDKLQKYLEKEQSKGKKAKKASN